ncbi:FmdB family zinc ribbon protein [Effusibacillus dendaii]|uniref:Putative regulatory protein FmdB zinc ribbon domain-containing protein n=1 Tax=Effusibacillus dendaii TaxID=2743772 RepID=A0A7I8D723_9BACL|nr:FmdB family zinc ribbon protein [Effusibacillus dendaii]BCJ85963.1 hypothetical protein skT53_09480 [Effusibacillus dendaii]
MPIYRFECPDCGAFEERLSVNELPSTLACPICKQMAKRIYTAPFVWSMGAAIRKRVTESTQPKRMSREELTHSAHTHHGHAPKVGQRPWQVGH